jgi:hypothetical protein
LIEGTSGGGPARLTVADDALEVVVGAQAGQRIPLDEQLKVSVSERGPTTLFLVAGVFLIALAALWAINRTVAVQVWVVVGAAGCLGVALGRRLGRVVVTVVAAELRMEIVCAGRMRKQAREVVEALRERRPDSARKPAATVVRFVASEVEALFSSESRRRREYRLIAGATGREELEARFVAIRGRIAAWNLAFTLALPLVGAGAAFFLAWPRGATGALVAASSAFVALVFVGLKTLPHTQGLLARWLS